MSEIRITDNVIVYNDMPRGWTQGKYQPIWHRRIYDMWRHMWRRVYVDIDYFNSLIHPSFQYLSSFVRWMESQPNFDDFCKTCDKVIWSVDKDSKYLGNRNYYPEYMTLMTISDNVKERNNRKGNPTPKQSVIGLPLNDTKKVILALSICDVSKYGFHQGHVSECLAKIYKFHKGYKWYRVHYKHNKRFRIKGE